MLRKIIYPFASILDKISFALLICFVGNVFSQVPPAPANSLSAPAGKGPEITKTPVMPQGGPQQVQPDKPRQDDITITRLNSMNESLGKISENVNRLSAQSGWFAFGIAAITALITGLMAFFNQKMLMAHQKKLNGDQASHQSSMSKAQIDHQKELSSKQEQHQMNMSSAQSRNVINNLHVEFQIKQISEFYGPLYALLGQSDALYNQMKKALIKADNNKFRNVTGDDTSHFEICLDSDWVRFRTIRHLSEVYNKHYGINAYFDEIILIGGRMTNLIQEKAGYVRFDQEELIAVLGQYLAHYSVLNFIYKETSKVDNCAEQANKPTTSHIVDDSATFPRMLKGLIKKGFDNINMEIRNWQASGHSETEKR